MAFPLLDIPPEIREKIYLLTLTSPYPISLTESSMPLISASPTSLDPPRRHHLFPHALLLTCHQIYHEIRPLYFTRNAFSLFLVRDPSPLRYFLDPSFRDNRRRIRSFQLVISRWGRHDFFLNEFAPLLEDMILNGGLRDLEVWVRKGYIHYGGKENLLDLKQVEAVDRLLDILKDPYLEKVTLRTYLVKESVQSSLKTLRDVTSSIDRP